MLMTYDHYTDGVMDHSLTVGRRGQRTISGAVVPRDVMAEALADLEYYPRVSALVMDGMVVVSKSYRLVDGNSVETAECKSASGVLAEQVRRECVQMLEDHPHLAPTLARILEIKAEAEGLGAAFVEDIPSHEVIAGELVGLVSAHGIAALALHAEFASMWASVVAVVGPDPRGQELLPVFVQILMEV